MYHGEEPSFLKREEGDILLCADRGAQRALEYGMKPDLVIGDFDSMPLFALADSIPVRVLPEKKDDTDMLACIREGRKRGYREFRIGGGMGGRIDHTIANIQCLADCARRGERAWLCDEQNLLTVLYPDEYIFDAVPGRKLSLFAFGGNVTGMKLKGTEWELDNAELSGYYPVGCSNWFKDSKISLSFASGLLIIAFCKDAE